MLYDYILKNYEKDEPIFLSELPGDSRDYVRQEMKKLVDDGKLERLFNGVYYLSYTTILGTKGKMSIDKYVDKRICKYPKCGFFYCKKIHCVIPGSGVPEYLSRRTDG